MRKGLKTLLAVAVGLMAVVQAFAEAPTIKEIPSPVVGNTETATPANVFVYPDAINLTDMATDDTSSPAELLWSYDITGTAKYLINGVGVNAGNKILPGAKQINTQDLDNSGPGHEGEDANAATITIRNIHLSPMGGPLPYHAPASATSEDQLVTFYASDGSLVSDPKTIWFYTETGPDKLSPEVVPVIHYDYEGNTDGFTYTLGSGGETSSTEGGHAICLVTADNQIENSGWWTGSYGGLELVKNSVYRVRALLNGSQASGGTVNNVPFFDLIINNFTSAFHGMNLYGANYFILDQPGRANAVTNVGSLDTDGKNIDLWWCPSPITTPQWNVETNGANAGPFAPAQAVEGVGTGKDAFIQFRVLDTPSNGGINANVKSGTLCLRDLTIDRWDLGLMSTVGSVLYHPTIASSNYRMEGGGYTLGFAGGAVTATPTTAGQTSGLAGVVPGDGVVDYGNPTTLTTNWPVAMDPQSLYLMTMSLSATSASDIPPEVFWMGADSVTNETICMTYVTYNCNRSAMPTTTPQDYKSLFWSNYGTAASNPVSFAQFRPRFMVANVGLNPDANTGSIKINDVSVQKVTFPGM